MSRASILANLVTGAVLLAGASILALGAVSMPASPAMPAPASSQIGTGPGGTLPPCPTEDSTGCYWDADTMGNGLGHDVVTPSEEGAR